MTLSTDLVIVDPIDARKVFDFTLALVAEGFPRDPKWEHDEDRRRYSTTVGQGLPAWTFVHYATDGPLLVESEEEWREWAEEGETFDPPPCNEHCIRIDWDTGYSYRGTNGEGCGDLHARYVATVGHWLDEQGKRWWWKNEFTGEWHNGHEGLDSLGNAGDDARSWFVGTVRPAIEAGLL